MKKKSIVIVPRSEIVFSDRTVKVKRALSLSQLQKRRRLLSLYQLEESAILYRTVTVPIKNGVLEKKSPWEGIGGTLYGIIVHVDNLREAVKNVLADFVR